MLRPREPFASILQARHPIAPRIGRSQALSDSDLKVMSVDIPSGWDVETLGATA